MRSQTSMISAMLWSISSTPAPCSSRTRADDGGERRAPRPRAGRRPARPCSTKRGSVASARATPSRRSSPCASAAGGRLGVARRGRAGRAARRRRAPRLARAGADAERRHLDVLAHGERPERVAVLERAREARAGRGGAALQRVTSRPSSSTVPVVGRSKPAEQVDERRLAGAVRPDQADDLVPVQLERDVAQRVHAVERARDSGGPERCSGPPRLLDCAVARPTSLDLRDDLGG